MNTRWQHDVNSDQQWREVMMIMMVRMMVVSQLVDQDKSVFQCVCVCVPSSLLPLSALLPCLLPFLSTPLFPSGSKLVHLQKIPTTLTLIQLKASGCAKNMSSHRLLHIMIIDRAGLTEAGILHTSAVHNWSDNSPWNSGCSNCLLRCG